MTALSIQNLLFGFGERILLNKISFDVNEKEKVGLIGANGIGKSTLFKIIKGEITDYEGMLSFNDKNNIGYMEQHTCSNPNKTIYDELISCFDYLTDIEIRLNEVNYLLENTDENRDYYIGIQDELYSKFNNNGGLTYKARTRSALTGLGFSESEFSLTVDKLSGGQRSKLALAKLLLSKPNFLLLDEPTNHLDIHSVEWLESFLKNYNGTLLIISHDRYFLDKVTNKTVELTSYGARCYKGNYTDFIKKRDAVNKSIEDKYKNDLAEIERLNGIVEQQRRWNREKNIKTAESKLKEINRIKEQLVKPESYTEHVRIKMESTLTSGNDVLFVKNLSMSFGNRFLFNDVNIHVTRGEKVFIIGENGCGKSTLFKILRSVYTPVTGSFLYGENLKVGYFDQVQSDLNLNNTAIEEIRCTYPLMSTEQIRKSLAAFLFRDDDVFKKLSDLSGGERARIALLKLSLGNYNFLLLDEPTNHLDSFSREELESALSDYTGTMLVISHDRYFINKIATRILDLSEKGLTEYLGNYDYYVEKSASNNSDSSLFVKAKVQSNKNNEYKQKKELNAEKRKLKSAITVIENEIELTEADIKELESELTRPEIISDYVSVTELTATLEEKSQKLEELYYSWDKTQNQLSLIE